MAIATWNTTLAAIALNEGRGAGPIMIAFWRDEHTLTDGTLVKPLTISSAKRLAKAFLAFPTAPLVISEGTYKARDLDAEARNLAAEALRMERFARFCVEDGVSDGKAQVVSTRDHVMDSNGRTVPAGTPFTLNFAPDGMGYPTVTHTTDEAVSTRDSLPASRWAM